MKIDYEKLNRNHWFEDAEGNEVDKDDPKAEYYHHCFPCELNHKVDSYRYRPKNPIVKWLCKNDRFYNYMVKKYIHTSFARISKYIYCLFKRKIPTIHHCYNALL